MDYIARARMAAPLKKGVIRQKQEEIGREVGPDRDIRGLHTGDTHFMRHTSHGSGHPLTVPYRPNPCFFFKKKG